VSCVVQKSAGIKRDREEPTRYYINSVWYIAINSLKCLHPIIYIYIEL